MQEIAVAVITGVLAVVGSWVGNITVMRKKAHADEIRDAEREVRQSMRLDAIEKKLDTHNEYGKKFGDIQKDIAVVKKDIEYLRKEKIK